MDRLATDRLMASRAFPSHELWTQHTELLCKVEVCFLSHTGSMFWRVSFSPALSPGHATELPKVVTVFTQLPLPPQGPLSTRGCGCAEHSHAALPAAQEVHCLTEGNKLFKSIEFNLLSIPAPHSSHTYLVLINCPFYL